MGLQVRQGIAAKPFEAEKLRQAIEALPNVEGIFYVGYPILYTAGRSITIDALWISERYGVIVFDLCDAKTIGNQTDAQDFLYAKIESMLVQYPSLSKRRKFQVPIEVIAFAPNATSVAEGEHKVAMKSSDISAFLKDIAKWESSDLYPTVVSVVQNVVNLRAKVVRTNVTRDDSRGGIMRSLEDKISNLDAEQEKAVIEFFDGVQRIRGLAGSGKTVVLALKAAYLHTQYPNWDIAVTFYSRALKQQLRDLIERFCIEKKGELPNWEKVTIAQAWGGASSQGIYAEYCARAGVVHMASPAARTYRYTSGNFDKTDFEAVCDKALSEAEFKDHPAYDAILVDEAQDLSGAFLKICYRMLREPRRMIYAYDELQKLNEGSSLPAPTEIFGVEAKDTILKRCYRNSRPVLVTAHALGFGIYRSKGLVQFFDQPKLWEELGYSIVEGKLKEGHSVRLERSHESSPKYLEEHSPISDLVVFKKFDNANEMAQAVANEVQENLNSGELLHRDILIIHPESRTSKSTIPIFKAALAKKGIKCHLTGDLNADVFFEDNSIAFTGIYRAKGNEASMVYIVNADYCFSGHEYSENLALINRRNTLFTAITRSKSWVRLYGTGSRMDQLIDEYRKIEQEHFALKFRYPNSEEIKHLNLIHRDLSATERDKIRQGTQASSIIMGMVEDIQSGSAVIENYPKELQEILRKLIQ